MTWHTRAACRRDPDMWFTDSERVAAVHICRSHCPVVEECNAALATTVISHGVMGGVAFGDHGLPTLRNGVGKSATVCGPDCRPFRRTTGEGEE